MNLFIYLSIYQFIYRLQKNLSLMDYALEAHTPFLSKISISGYPYLNRTLFTLICHNLKNLEKIGKYI